MPLTEFETELLRRVDSIGHNVSALQTAVASLHSDVGTIKRLTDGFGPHPPLSERVLRLESAITSLEGYRRAKEEEGRWFKRLVISQVVQWLITGGGIAYLIASRSA